MATAATISSLPDELLLQILSHNVPNKLNSRLDFSAYIHNHAYSKRFLRLARDSFFQTFTHDIDLTCYLSNLTRTKTFTTCETQGVLVGKKSFVAQVRRANVRLHVNYPESLDKAMAELKGVLGRHGRLRSVRIGVDTASYKVAEEAQGRVEVVLDEVLAPGASRKMEVFLMGQRMVEGKC